MKIKEILSEKWSEKYKSSINYANPKGFSQRAHCQGRKKNEDQHPNEHPIGPEFKPTMPKGTIRVKISDVYDWYKLGMHISDLKGLGKHDFGEGPPEAIISFGSEDQEHQYIELLKKLGLEIIDVDPMYHGDKKGVKTDPNYNVGGSYTDDIYHIYAQHPQLSEGEVIQGYFNKKQRDAAALDQERQEYVKQENELQRKLKKLAAFWYHNDEDPTVERKLKKLGWEIGQDEGYDGDPGVFVVKTGDYNGNSYISWSSDDLLSINDAKSANENAALNNIDESLSDFIDSAKSKIQKLKAILSVENAETKQMLKIYRLALEKKAAPEQIKIANDQFKDILKLVGLGAFSALPIPGGVLLIVALEKLLNKKGMSILPSAFRPTTKIESAIPENFADGRKPGRKGLSKRMGVPTKASVSRLRQIAKSSSGERARMAHWLANMKSGRKKK